MLNPDLYSAVRNLDIQKLPERFAERLLLETDQVYFDSLSARWFSGQLQECRGRPGRIY